MAGRSWRKRIVKKVRRNFGFGAATAIAKLLYGDYVPKVSGTLSDPVIASAVAAFPAKSRATTELCRIMGRLGSDKGSDLELDPGRTGHNYTAIYETLFAGLRDQPVVMFELGIGTLDPNAAKKKSLYGTPGASLRGWREYFPKGLVFAADIDRSVLIQEDRIQSFYCDQTSAESIAALWAQPNLATTQFDILIEDGLHTVAAGISFLEGAFHKVKPGGIYVVEDIRDTDVSAWINYLTSAKSVVGKLPWVMTELPHLAKTDNNLLIIRRP